MDFTQIKYRDEVIIWRGKPSLVSYFSKDIASIIGLTAWIFTLALLPWFLTNFSEIINLDLEEVSRTQNSDQIYESFLLILVSIFTLPLLLIYLILLFSPINTLLNFLDEDYALTDKRVIISKGAIKTSITSFYYNDIRNLEVKVGIIESALGVGTIKIYTGEIDFDSGLASAHKNWLVGVEAPESVYAAIQSKSQHLSNAVYF